MPGTLWQLNNRLILDADGRRLACDDDCPCDDFGSGSGTQFVDADCGHCLLVPTQWSFEIPAGILFDGPRGAPPLNRVACQDCAETWEGPHTVTLAPDDPYRWWAGCADGCFWVGPDINPMLTVVPNGDFSNCQGYWDADGTIHGWNLMRWEACLFKIRDDPPELGFALRAMVRDWQGDQGGGTFAPASFGVGAIHIDDFNCTGPNDLTNVNYNTTAGGWYCGGWPDALPLRITPA